MNSSVNDHRFFVVFVEHAIVRRQRKHGWVHRTQHWIEVMQQFYQTWQNQHSKKPSYAIDHNGTLQLFTSTEAADLKDRLLQEDPHSIVHIYELVPRN